jgi:uncharacterized protein YjbI with pentapeptide repeats
VSGDVAGYRFPGHDRGSLGPRHQHRGIIALTTALPVRRRAALVASLSFVLALGGVSGASPAAAVAPVCPTVVGGSVVPFPAPGTSIDCTGASLAGADLRGADLTGWQFQGADLHGADLTGATLLGADLFQTDLSGATLDQADLSYTFVVGTKLIGASLGGATLNAAKIDGVDLSGAALVGAALTGLDTGTVTTDGATTIPSGWQVRGGLLLGPGVVFSGRTIKTADLSNLDLTGANLAGAILENAKATGAVLTGADLRGTDLAGADLTGATGVASVLANTVTSWFGATCPEGKLADAHDGRACNRALDLVAPKATVGTAPAFTRSNAFFVATTFSDAGSGIWGWRILRRTIVSGGSTWSAWATDAWSGDNPKSIAAFVSPGHRTCMRVQVRDFAGHVTTVPGERCSDAVYDSTGNRFFPDEHWAFGSDKSYFEWSYESTRTHGAQIASASRLYVRQVGVIASTCPTCGSVSVYVGSTRVGTINLRRSVSTSRTLLTLPRLSTRRYGVVKVVVVSAPGRLVRVDAVAVTGV